MKQEVKKTIVAYAVVLGALYIAFGVMELGLWICGYEGLGGVVPPDHFGAFAALVAGATYLSTISLLKGVRESWGYVLAGLLLSAILGIVYLLIACADGLGTLLSTLEGGEWTWEWLTSGTAGTGLLRPEIWLFFASLPLAYLTLRTLRLFNILGE
jgi:hypothetical protein